MSIQEFPQELLCQILSGLDELSLQACALTCRALTSPAQAAYFRSLSENSESSVESAVRRLESAPSIAAFVKHLHVMEIHRPWIQHSKVLPRLLAILAPSTVSLEIHLRQWKPELSRLPYSSFARLERVETIDLTEEGWPGCASTTNDHALPTFLNHFPRLRSLTLAGYLPNHDTGNKSGPAPPIFQLEKLVGSCLDTLALDWLIPALTSLRFLSIRQFTSHDLRFIATAGQSLQCLEVTYASDTDTQLLMNAIRMHATNLRTLRLSVFRGPSVQGPKPLAKHTEIHAVIQSLLFIGSHAHLEQLIFRASEYYAHIDGNPWNELQDLILGTAFPRLRCIEVLLTMGSNAPKSPEPILAAVSQLIQKRMFHLSITQGY
ncbi:hypothetical protein H0H87_010281 [Tephrocybe sp. NHM501043]|nr:hypothetical protein H0H87_010281 [Tephrocybe sp. NHM501043]